MRKETFQQEKLPAMRSQTLVKLDIVALVKGMDTGKERYIYILKRTFY